MEEPNQKSPDTTGASGPKGGILDAVIESQHAAALADFNPHRLVSDMLLPLKEREQLVLKLRYGLDNSKPHTLESIGKKVSLTRERVRQIEKETIQGLRQSGQTEDFVHSMDIVKKTIADHGGVFAHHALSDKLLVADKSEPYLNALTFLLELSEHFNFLAETDVFHSAWHIEGFEFRRLDDFHKAVRVILEKSEKPIDFDNLKSEFRVTDLFQQDPDYFSDRVIENLVLVLKQIKANPFGEFGLHHWRVIRPRDVGDKAYLVLQHHGKPEHYAKITEMINQHRFDERTAYKETVHNELIMDPRFVLVGRGIYALSEWGYKEGLVADVICEILKSAREPVDRDQIIEEVLKQRLVRRNTILVALANRKLFQKIGKGKYTLAP